MTFLEAIKTGKPFKRKCHEHWVIHNPYADPPPEDYHGEQDLRLKSLPFIMPHNGLPPVFWPSAMLSTDWEIKE